MRTGVNHLVECRCILPQFKSLERPIFHKFIVFSVVDDNDNVIVKHVRCNNCSTVHRVFDLCKSEILHESDSNSVAMSIDDIRLTLPRQVVAVLEAYDAPIHTWEESQFVINERQFDRQIVISAETDGDIRHVKMIRIHEDMRVEMLAQSFRHTLDAK